MIIMGNKKNECAPPKVEYRYIPRDFNMEQYDRLPIMATYGKLFTHNDPWEESIGYPGIFYDKREQF